MTTVDWGVIAAGVALTGWVLWFFFIAEQGAATATAGTGGVQDVSVRVHGGYEPATIRVKAGVPVRLHFDRQETSSCSEEIVFPDFNVRRFLPAFQETVVEVTPPSAGTYEFTCGMSMLHGRLVAE